MGRKSALAPSFLDCFSLRRFVQSIELSVLPEVRLWVGMMYLPYQTSLQTSLSAVQNRN
jgi:hypothetical protein